MKTKITLWLLAFTPLLACNNETPTNARQQTANESNQVITVTTARAVAKNYQPTLPFSGTLLANKEANLGAAVPGRVEEVYYDEGRYVKKGDLLVSLSGELLTQAMAEYEVLKKDLDRLTRLKEKGSVSQQDYDHLKARYEAAEAKAALMRKNTEIRAPFSGTIVSYQVKKGENYLFAPKLQQGYSHTSGIVSLMQLNPLKVEITINEKDLQYVKEGMTATVRTDAYPNEPLQGQLVHIAPTLSPSSRTAKAHIRISNPGRKLKPGMFAQVQLQLSQQQGVFVPLAAIYRLRGTGNDYVFVVQPDSTVRRIGITRGATQGKLIAIDALNPGDEVVLTGKNKLANGTQVAINNESN